MRVGIDFDNTIADYDQVFAAAARSRGWVSPDFAGTKKQLRDAVRLLEEGEIKWQMLQAEVYGARMGEAVPFPGCADFLRAARRANLDLYVISHKTQYSKYDPHKVDLRQAALRWLKTNRFFDPAFGLSDEKVFFEDTREHKIERLRALDCDVFIDDLEEVFAHPSFPTSVECILFTAANDEAPLNCVATCRTWQEINRRVLDNGAHAGDDATAHLVAVAKQLTGAPIRALRRARAGGNNRLFQLETDDGRFALKIYFRQAGDDRDRLRTEYEGLSFLRRHGVTEVPMPIAADRAEGVALYEWIEGEPASASPATVDAAVEFVARLESIKDAADAGQLPLASEACLSPKAILQQIERRLATLRAVASRHADLDRFLTDEFTPALHSASISVRGRQSPAGLSFDVDLARNRHCLNPSDFGFHNVLVQADGRVVFLDFEYFGWDDPVKLTSDFLLHPGMDLTIDLRRRFLHGACHIFGVDRSFEKRLRLCLPLYALRWTMILLNDFLPERWQRRVLAGNQHDRSVILQGQLQKARAMLAGIDPAEGWVVTL
jgi:hypothetical protein